MTKKEAQKMLPYWEEILAKYKDQKSRNGGYLGTDLLPISLGASIDQSISWVEEEIRLLKEIK